VRKNCTTIGPPSKIHWVTCHFGEKIGAIAASWEALVTKEIWVVYDLNGESYRGGCDLAEKEKVHFRQSHAQKPSI